MATEYSLLSGPQPKYTDEEFESGTTWSLFPTKPLGEFLATLKEKYRSLEQIPLPKNDGGSGHIRVGGGKRDEELGVWTFSASQSLKRVINVYDLQEIRQIYHNHGWPSADFRKEDCKSQLQLWYKAWLDKEAAKTRQ